MTVGSNLPEVERAPAWIRLLGKDARRRVQGHRYNAWDHPPHIAINDRVYGTWFTEERADDPDHVTSIATVFGIPVRPDASLARDEVVLRYEFTLPPLECTCGTVEHGVPVQHLSPCPFYVRTVPDAQV
jgi:hypothetical protein